jgi:3-hydroxyisobutyrate dehydrogenase-like beta-hydroxyacid dehydrogenase
MDIGFIGLGNMGFHMARRLLEAGHTVIALDTRKEVLAPSRSVPSRPPRRRRSATAPRP